MRKYFKNNSAVSSPLEFMMVSVVLISAFGVVAASLSSNLQQEPVQNQATTQTIAAEVASLLLSSDPLVGLVDPAPLGVYGPIITELDEGDDITVLFLDCNPPNPTSGQQVTVSFSIENLGTNNLDDVGYTIELDGVAKASDSNLVFTGLQTRTFNPQFTVTGSNGDVLPGWINVSTVLDTNLSNNSATFDVTISSGNSPPTFKSQNPSNGEEGVSISLGTLSITIGDPDGDSFDWTIQTSPNVGSNSQIKDTDGVKSCSIEILNYETTYTWFVNATDPAGSGQWTRAVYTFTTEAAGNSPPNKPDTPSGPISGQPGVSYEYTTSTTDPDGDDVYYYWDWDELSGMESWIGPYSSGSNCQKSHSWGTDGTYDVRVKAKDGAGAESEWSDALTVTISSLVTPCFLAKTQIAMTDGTFKNIEDVKVGDMLKTYDEKTDDFKDNNVVKVFHSAPELLKNDFYLIINDEVKVTPDHLFYINEEWIFAGSLKVGDFLSKGKVISLEKIYEKVPTFNLEMQTYHNYIVPFSNGDYIIAHNSNYYVGGNEETQTNQFGKSTISDYDYTAILDMNRIDSLGDTEYSILSERLGVSDSENRYFFLRIYNDESTFLNILPKRIDAHGQPVYVTRDLASSVAYHRESVMIHHDSNFISAILEVTVISFN